MCNGRKRVALHMIWVHNYGSKFNVISVGARAPWAHRRWLCHCSLLLNQTAYCLTVQNEVTYLFQNAQSKMQQRQFFDINMQNKYSNSNKSSFLKDRDGLTSTTKQYSLQSHARVHGQVMITDMHLCGSNQSGRQKSA